MKDQMTAAEFRAMKGNKTSREKQHIEEVLFNIGIPYEREFMFVPDRLFKADWAIPEKKILIEYEGLVFSSNRKTSTGASGHTTITGYVSNCEKYNFATLLGYRLLRYTAKTYKQVRTDLQILLSQ